MRKIALDTETTGGNIKDGDRAIDIGLIEMIDGKRTGRTWQTYLNPEGRKSHWGALRVHGIKDSFLLDKPLFKDVADEMLAFIDGAPCLAHGARFDRDVIIAEFYRSGLEIPNLTFYDTVKIAKRCVQGKKHSIDALVEKLGLTTPDRTKHGALLDTDILCMILEDLHQKHPNQFDVDLVATAPEASLPAFLRGTVHDPRTTHPMVLTMPGTKPFKPEAEGKPAKSKAPEPGSLNEGVGDVISAVNATEGSVEFSVAATLRTKGRDGFSYLSASEAYDAAVEKFGKEDVDRAFLAVDEPPNSGALRWMCRGLKPDRWSQCRLAVLETLPEDRDRVYDDRKPDSPGRDALNAGVAEAIDKINATTGPVGRDISRLMRTNGNDAFSGMSNRKAMDAAQIKFPKEDVLAAIDGLSDRAKAKAVRWMCRGVTPDRWKACKNPVTPSKAETAAAKDKRIADIVPQEPSEDPGSLNYGVSDKIAKLNETDGPIRNKKTLSLLRTNGYDGFSRLSLEEALHLAEKRFSKDEIKEAFRVKGGRADSNGLRWMSRGVRPDRWAACEELRQEMAVRSGSKPESDVDLIIPQEENDIMGIEM